MSLNNLCLHPITRLQLNNFLASPAQALLLYGPDGSGKSTTISHLSAALLNTKLEAIDNHPYYYSIGESDDKLTIEHIRQLQKFLKLKVPKVIDSNQAVDRLLVVHKAQSLREDAQNALLKTLEETPQGTVVILSANDIDSLLPTILSRTQRVEIFPVSHSQAKHFFEHRLPADFDTIFNLSNGQVGLLTSLIDHDNSQLLDDINKAKIIISSPKSERVLRVDEILKDKVRADGLIQAILRISRAAIRSSAKTNNNQSLHRWLDIEDRVIEYINNSDNNVQTKLNMTYLFSRL